MIILLGFVSAAIAAWAMSVAAKALAPVSQEQAHPEPPTVASPDAGRGEE